MTLMAYWAIDGNNKKAKVGMFSRTKVRCLARSLHAAVFHRLVEDTDALMEPHGESCALEYLDMAEVPNSAAKWEQAENDPTLPKWPFSKRL